MNPAASAPAGTGELSPVSRTAIGVARERAREGSRPDPLFEDPYAQAFVTADADGRSDLVEPDREELSPGLRLHISVRTRFYDDYLLVPTCQQVVLLGAGLDTRAFRLPWPSGTVVYELDLPPVLDFKDRVLTEEGAVATCERRPVPVDLTTDWRDDLARAGFRPNRPTAWLAEGLLVYLGTEVAGRVLDEVLALSWPGSRFACEAPRSSSDEPEVPAVASATLSAMWKGGLGEGAAAQLDRHGWSVQIHHLRDLASDYGRDGGANAQSGFLVARAPSS